MKIEGRLMAHNSKASFFKIDLRSRKAKKPVQQTLTKCSSPTTNFVG